MNSLLLNSETLRILTKFCNEKPSKYRNVVKICNELVKKVKNMVSQTGSRVVRSNFCKCKGPNLSWKRAKKEPKGQTKILGPGSVIWDQISEIWPQKGQPGNPGLTTAELRHIHYRIVCEVTHRTVFIMSSQ